MRPADQPLLDHSGDSDSATTAQSPLHRATSPPGSGLIPIVVGIIGSRHILPDKSAELELALRNIFTEIRRDYPSTPLLTLSSLAEGADCIGARVALEFGSQLIVPLPIPLPIFETDFQRSDSRAEFNALASRATRVFELPLLEGMNPEDMQVRGNARDMQYANAGAYVARYSQILIACWDGSAPSTVAGTAQTVRFRLDGIPEPFVKSVSPLDVVECGPVIQIITPTPQYPIPNGTPYSVVRHYPESYGEEAVDAFQAILERIEIYNRDETVLDKDLAELRVQSAAQLCPTDLIATLPEGADLLLDRFARADSMALYYRKHTSTTLRLIFVFAFVGIFCFELYGHLMSNQHWMLALYLGALVGATLIYRRSNRSEHQIRYLDYRALAEGLRVQFFWRVAGIPDLATDHYLRHQRTVLEWIRQAIRTSAVVEAPFYEVENPHQESLREHLVMRRWIEEQASYFPQAAHRLEQRRHRMERVANICFMVAIVVAVAQMIVQGGHVIIFAIGTMLLIAGALTGYVEKRSYKELAKQYARMGVFFNNADIRMREYIVAKDVQGCRRLVRDLGVEALEENGDWVQIHRHRPIAIPKGG